MPTIQIDLKTGYSVEQKRALAREATKTICEVLGIAPEGVRILLRDVDQENYAVAGELWLDYLASTGGGGRRKGNATLNAATRRSPDEKP